MTVANFAKKTLSTGGSAFSASAPFSENEIDRFFGVKMKGKEVQFSSAKDKHGPKFAWKWQFSPKYGPVFTLKQPFVAPLLQNVLTSPPEGDTSGGEVGLGLGRVKEKLGGKRVGSRCDWISKASTRPAICRPVLNCVDPIESREKKN